MTLAAADTEPAGLHAALLADAGGAVAGAHPGHLDGAPSIAGLPPARASALLAAWTGARLHAGSSGLLAADDPDIALLTGDWCFAHALRAVAAAGDLQAIALLAGAIGRGATGTRGEPAGLGELAEIWDDASRQMSCSQ